MLMDYRHELQELLGAARILSGDRLAAHDIGIDGSNFGADFAVLPQTTEEISAIVSICSRHGIAMVPQGGRTGLSGGTRSVEGQVLILMHAMAMVSTVDPISQVAIVEAGCPLEVLEKAVRSHGLTCGIDLGARGTATIGGMISTNAGGQEAFRFGPMRHRVLGLEAVLPDGRILKDLTQVLKANGGYDVKQLLIGSEGTLGIVTRAVIRLSPFEEAATTALVICPALDSGIRLFRRLEASSGGRLLRAELMSANHVAVTASDHDEGAIALMARNGDGILFEFTDAAILEAELAHALEQGWINDAVIAKNERERAAFWKIREDWAVDRAYPDGLWFDVSVPLSSMPTYLLRLSERLANDDNRLNLFYIGHLGDGNLHITINAESSLRHAYTNVSALVYERLKEAGGFFSAEHGIGEEKRNALLDQSDPVRLSLMRSIKSMFDPKGIMNPGKVLARNLSGNV